MRIAISLLVVAFMCRARCNNQHDTEAVLRGLALSLRYDQVRWLSSHNSYDRGNLAPSNPPWKRSIREQLDSGIRSFELDLHQANDRRCDWDVAHVTAFGGCGDYCCSLRQCLRPFYEWHQEHPNHEVVTIFLEMKDDWENAHFQEPGDLDLIIESLFTPEGRDRGNFRKDSVFSPTDLRFSPEPSSPWYGAPLRDIVRAAGWPTLAELNGKFIFVLQGGDLGDGAGGDALWRYPTDYDHYGHQQNDPTCDGRPAVLSKYCFIAPDLVSVAQITTTWSDKASVPFGTRRDVVFANIHYHPRDWRELHGIGPTAHEAGVNTRAWKIDDNDPENPDYRWALTNAVNHIVTDHISRDQFEPRMAFLQLGFAAEAIE